MESADHDRAVTAAVGGARLLRTLSGQLLELSALESDLPPELRGFLTTVATLAELAEAQAQTVRLLCARRGPGPSGDGTVAASALLSSCLSLLRETIEATAVIYAQGLAALADRIALQEEQRDCSPQHTRATSADLVAVGRAIARLVAAEREARGSDVARQGQS